MRPAPLLFEHVFTHKRNRKLVYVVPLSTSPPQPTLPYHYFFESSPVHRLAPIAAWAKCDMVAVVSIERLSMIRWSPMKQDGVLSMPRISEEEFGAIRRCVAIAFGLGVGSYIRAEMPEKIASEVDVREKPDTIFSK